MVDAEGREVGPGEVGELTVRGPYTIRGYYRLPEHNAKAFSADGFYRTGDRVSRDKDGYLVVEGRDKDQINRGGEKIAAEEVENLLIAHPQVHDATVVAMPDSLLGERTCAFVIPRQPAPSALKLKQYLHACGLAAFKVPDRIELVPAFPRPASARSARRTCASACAASWRPAHERRLGPAVPPDADAAPAPGLLPHAGGSASFFRSWSERLPPDIDLLALQYPGREDRFNEAPATRLEDLSDGAALALRDFADAPLALFGHSLGAALAYETALRLEASARRCATCSSPPIRHRTGNAAARCTAATRRRCWRTSAARVAPASYSRTPTCARCSCRFCAPTTRRSRPTDGRSPSPWSAPSTSSSASTTRKSAPPRRRPGATPAGLPPGCGAFLAATST